MTVIDCTQPDLIDEAVHEADEALRHQGLVVFAADSVYGIACDAFTPAATTMLRTVTGQPRRHPLPVLVPTIERVRGVVTAVPTSAMNLMEAFWPGALTLVCTAQPSLSWDLGDGPAVVAVRVPQHPVAKRLLTKTGPLAVTGAVRGYDANHVPLGADPAAVPDAALCATAIATYGDRVSIYLDSGPLFRPGPSTVVDVTGEYPRLLRPGAIGIDDLRRVAPNLIVEQSEISRSFDLPQSSEEPGA